MAFRASCAFDPVQYSTVGKCSSGLSLLLWHDLPHFSKRLLNLLVFLLLFTKNATFWETLPPHPGFPIVGGHEGGAPLTLFKMGFFGAAYGWGVLFGGGMKLGTVIPYQRKTQKVYKSPDTFLEFC